MELCVLYTSFRSFILALVDTKDSHVRIVRYHYGLDWDRLLFPDVPDESNLKEIGRSPRMSQHVLQFG